MIDLILIAHNLRSTHNVGSLLRTADGLGISKTYLTGYTPYPSLPDDDRLPHLHQKLTRQISKTALGAEANSSWEYRPKIHPLLRGLELQGYTLAALEQTATSQSLPNYQPPGQLAIIVGREVKGIEPEIIKATQVQLVIPMFGQKESYNVVQAAAMALYHCRFYNQIIRS